VHIVETLPHQSFDGWAGQKMLEGASTSMLLPTPGRSVATSSRVDALTKSNRHFAACRGLALARGSEVTRSAFAFRSASCCIFRQSPKPTIETAHRDTIEVNRPDGITERQAKHCSTEQSGNHALE